MAEKEPALYADVAFARGAASTIAANGSRKTTQDRRFGPQSVPVRPIRSAPSFPQLDRLHRGNIEAGRARHRAALAHVILVNGAG